MARSVSQPKVYFSTPNLKPHFFIGILLIVIFWSASWLHLGAAGEYSFFPLWLGYILVVDALVARRRGDSLLMRHPRHLAALFVLSAPIWWLFEGINHFTLNWHYLFTGDYSPTQVILEQTIDFSTVVPAVFETTMLMLTFDFFRRLINPSRSFHISRLGYYSLMYLGAAMFFAIAFFPHLAFPLVWTWLFLLVDPLNALRGRPSLFRQFASGDYRMLAALGLAALVCGFFWELWNFYAMPKWYYTVPYVGVAKIFEMPLPGYLGYIPFAWELYALYQFVFGFLRQKTIVNVQP